MGGLGPTTAIVGPGNMYKSTILHYQMLSAMSKIWASTPTSSSTYDSEGNIHLPRLKHFTKMFPEFNDVDIIENGDWVISDATIYLGDEWYSRLREFMKDKRKNGKELMVKLPFNNREGKSAYEIVPTFSEIDSISAMHIGAAGDIMDKNDIGTSGGSHVFMREGLGKSQLQHELPSLAASANHYVLTTSHIGDRVNMSTGYGNAPPKKQLQFLPTDMKIKGATNQILYNQHNLWLVTGSSLLWNQSDKTTRYPKMQGHAIAEDKDLNIVTLLHIRGKAGPSGFKLDIIVSQDEGVLPSLTEFHALKERGSFGFDGNDRTYRLFLLPEETLQRTTVREKLDGNAKLRRAMNITSEIAQMYAFHKAYVGDKLMSTEDLVSKLKDHQYDLDFILSKTRGWWTYDNDQVAGYFLSTLDLLEMAAGRYTPYYLEDDHRTVKKEFKRSWDTH
ncbi:MAG TPA: hypothetical protein VN843_22560 [Anaerolineales bacterium]|nr:hypothetical protein [Anaerolineales bacterium]